LKGGGTEYYLQIKYTWATGLSCGPYDPRESHISIFCDETAGDGEITYIGLYSPSGSKCSYSIKYARPYERERATL